MSAGVIAALVCSMAGGEPTDNSGFANCDFEQGVEGWHVWYADEPDSTITRYAWSADAAVAHGGKQSLRIDAPDTNGRAFLHRSSEKVAPGGLYAVSYWFRTSPGLDEGAFNVRLNCWPAKPTSPRRRMIAIEPLITSRKAEGDWQQRSGFARMPQAGKMKVQLGLHLHEARGTIWIDDVRVSPVDASELAVAELWQYNPYRVPLGTEPVRKFQALQKAGDPILTRAARYNKTLVRSAFVKEDVRRVRRLASYGGADRQAASGLEREMATAEQDLARLYRAYGEAFLDRSSEPKAAAFDRQAGALAAKLEALKRKAAGQIAAAVRRRREAGACWDAPPKPLAAALPAIGPDGRVNQIIYAKRSLPQFQEIEKPLGLDPVHSVSMYSPGGEQPGRYDWSGVLRRWEDIRKVGIAKRTCLSTSMVLHDGSYAPPWIRRRAEADPEIVHVLRPPAELRQRGGRLQFNWWHPEVQQYARDVVGSMGRAFAGRDDLLFYVFQAECYGPYVATTKGLREVGYGRRAEGAFRDWLRRKYERIARLNTRWASAYASFDRIDPPADKYVRARLRTGPLAAEWEAWREQSYRDWRQLIYRAWKQADPNKPLLASHSLLYLRFNSPDEYDTCDMLGFHNRGADFMPVTLYIHSISRYNGFRPLAQYENFWGVQEDHGRMGEELPCRHSAQKHVFRLTAWSRFLQVWWYAYTTADYLTIYDGNWLDPSYALTTLRYRSAGLPVCFRKFKRLQRALLASRVVASRLCVLAPSASMRNNYPYAASQAETRDLFWRLFPRNDLFELVPEEYLADGRAKLDDFDALVLPAAAHLSEALQERIARWLKGGRRLLVACGPCGVYDELGVKSGKLLGKVFGAAKPAFRPPTPHRPGWAAEPAPHGGALRGRLGGSDVIVLLRRVCELAPGSEALARLVTQIEARAPRAAWDDKNVLELVVRADGRTRYLCALNPGVDAAAESVVHVRGAFGSVVDLDCPEGFGVPAKQAGGVTSFPLRLAPGEFTVLRLR